MAKIAIAGAGIIGATIAAELLLSGHEVTVFEPEPDGLPTSSGNAALIALPEVAPLASPGILTAVPGWLLDPLGPLTLRWTDVPALTPWLLAFLASATPSRGAQARTALTYLMKSALQDHENLAQRSGMESYLRQTGYLSVHDSEASIKGALAEAETVKGLLGYDYERVSPETAKQMIPQLEGQFVAAMHQPGYWAVTNPLTVLRAYQDIVRAKATLVPEKAVRLRQTDAGVEVSGTATKGVFDRVVVASGVWSRDLVRSLGAKVLLETERGYNTTYTDLGWNLSMPLGFADHGFIATPLVDGLRVGGAVELAKPETSPNFNRAKAMRTKMRRYIPSLPEGGKEWMGRRPSTPDSIPVISHHPGDKRIIHAFGHGHLGLTLSAVTARLVAGLVNDQVDASALAPFSLSRFQ